MIFFQFTYAFAQSSLQHGRWRAEQDHVEFLVHSCDFNALALPHLSLCACQCISVRSQLILKEKYVSRLYCASWKSTSHIESWIEIAQLRAYYLKQHADRIGLFCHCCLKTVLTTLPFVLATNTHRHKIAHKLHLS
jgi:hypothetical protein